MKIKHPSPQAVALVLQAADSAPRPNGNVSRQLDAALAEVGQYFRALYEPKNPKK